MRKRGYLSRTTGEMEWFDEKGNSCEPPADKLIEGDVPSQSFGKAGWPMKCEASGCHREQIGEFTKMMSDAGCPTDFTSDGRAIYTSRSHRAKALRVRGMFDKNAGYSDPAPA